jgi:hypothetical protein
VKKISGLTLATLAITTIILFSCNKDEDDVAPVPFESLPTAKKLQNIWKLQSIVVYANRSFTGDSLVGYIGNGNDIMDFRPNGKLVYYLLNTYDSTTYSLMPNDSTILYFEPDNQTTTPDTITIRSVTTNQLVLHKLNLAGDHGKFTFKR